MRLTPFIGGVYNQAKPKLKGTVEMDSIVKNRVRAFVDGLVKLSAETGVEVNASGEVDLYCSRNGRYIAGLTVEQDAYQVWCFGDTPEMTISRPQEDDNAP